MANSLKDLKHFITEGMKKMPEETKSDKQNREFFGKTLQSFERCEALLAEKDCKFKEEKEARLVDAATKWANQLAFILFQNGFLTDDLEKEYRTFDHFHITTEAAKVFYDERQKKKDELTEQYEVLTKEQQEIDTFTGVIGGKTKKEAKEAVQNYAKQAAVEVGVEEQ